MKPAAVMLLVLGLTSCGRNEAVPRPLRVGDPAPPYSATTLAGGRVRVGVGEPLTLLHFWATWCIPCRHELATVEQLQRDYGARGLRVLAISVDEGGDGQVREFVAHRHLSLEVGLDAGRHAQQIFQMVGLPETFLIDSHGWLLMRQVGAIPAGAADLRATIESALSEAQSLDSTNGPGSR